MNVCAEWGGAKITLWAFCVSAGVLFLGIPILNSTMSSLYSKQIECVVGKGRQVRADLCSLRVWCVLVGKDVVSASDHLC